MNLLTYVLILIICIGLIVIWWITIYNKFQGYIIRINEAESNIDATLRKRFDLLNKSINVIEAVCSNEKDVLDIILKLKSKKISNFEFDRKLFEAINEFNSYKDKYQELKSNENFIKIDLGLNESETELEAFRKYYNDIITDYNKMISAFPANIVARNCKYEIKAYFDGKDMYDKDTKDFKV